MKTPLKKFGVISVKKGYCTKELFVEAMAMQLENDLEGMKPKLFGEILMEMEYLNREQVSEVLMAMVNAKNHKE